MIGEIELLTIDRITIMNKAWENSCDEVETNKKAIA